MEASSFLSEFSRNLVNRPNNKINYLSTIDKNVALNLFMIFFINGSGFLLFIQNYL